MHRVERVLNRSSQMPRPLRMAGAVSHAKGAPPARMSNQVMQRRLIQAKLTVNKPGDSFEQEADRVSEAVMRVTDRDSSKSAGVTEQEPDSWIQRLCPGCEEDLQRQVYGRRSGRDRSRK